MYQRKVCSFATAFLFGVVFFEYFCAQLLVFGAIAVVLFTTVLFYKNQTLKDKALKEKTVFFMLCILFFLLGLARSWKTEQRLNAYETFLKDKEEVKAQGVLYQKEQKGETCLLYLKNCVVQFHQKNDSCSRLTAVSTSNAEECSVGEIICIKGKIKAFQEARNDGNYNEKEYYQSIGINGRLEDTEIIARFGKKDLFAEALYRLKCRIEKSLKACLNDKEAGVLIAMTLGNKTEMEKELKNLYQKVGISHFYCISGLHISILGMALYHFLKKRGVSFAVSSVLCAGIVFSYGKMTGFGISETRAIGMFFLLLYAKCRGRTYDRITAVSLLAAVMVWENPKILHNAGFLLSFGAIVGVILAEATAVKNTSDRIETLRVSVWIQCATIPILTQFFYEIPTYSVLINLIVLPCMSALLGFGLCGGLAGCFSVTAGRAILYPASLILRLFETVSRKFANLSNADLIIGKKRVEWVILWYLILGMFVLFIQITNRKKEERSIQMHSDTEDKKIIGIQKCAKAGVLTVLALMLFLRPAPQFSLDILDVGQGDGICLQTSDKTVCCIDGGSSNVSAVGTYRILPYLKYHGIRRVDYWFVSHCDNDHISGLEEIIKSGYNISTLVFSEKVVKDEAFQKLKDLAEEKQIKLLFMKQNAALKGGRGKKSWEMKCLFPNINFPKDNTDRNAASLVLLYKEKDFVGLFTGDIGAEQEAEIVSSTELQTADVYKAAHHGSKYSNSEEMLSAVSPKLTVISSALHNRYGHPNEETLERIKAVGSEIRETRYEGQVRIRKQKKRRNCFR